MKTSRGIVLGVLCAAVVMLTLVVAAYAQGEGYVLRWFRFAGGGVSTGAGYTLQSIEGQPLAGVASGGGYTLRMGSGDILTATVTPPTPTYTPTPTSTPAPAGDAYEPDNACADAKLIASDGANQSHSFFVPGDIDWLRFNVKAGLHYVIVVIVPPDAGTDAVLDLYLNCTEAAHEHQDLAFTTGVQLDFDAPADGSIFMRLRNHLPGVGGATYGYGISVRELATENPAGAVVIVAGKLNANDVRQPNIDDVGKKVYRLFAAHGYAADRIQFLATDLTLDADGDGQSDVDALANNTNLEAAITEWAPQRVSAQHPFTLYLVDHGGHDRFYLDGNNERVTAQQLNRWLTELEQKAPGVRINVIIEACQSGSFIVPADSLSRAGRVIISSTGVVQQAYVSINGAVFSDRLVAALQNGRSLFDAFTESTWAATRAHGDQAPMLDDNGNGVFDSGDGAEAQRRGFGFAGGLPPVINWPPEIQWGYVRWDAQGAGVLQARAVDDAPGVNVVAVIYPPGYTPPEVQEELVKDQLPRVPLQDANGDGLYEATYAAFTQSGEYRIVFEAQDSDGYAAVPFALVSAGGQSIYLPTIRR